MVRCSCCGFRTLLGNADYEICPVCYWQNGGDNKERGGPNNLVSLTEARRNFTEIGASDLLWIAEVRPPSLAEKEGVDATSVRTESGAELFALSRESPVLLVFLRHFGCSFCRKAISDVAELTPELKRRNVRPVFVHLGTPEIAQAHFAYYNIADVARIHDPEARLYREFDLGRENPARSLVNPKVLWGWFIRGDLFRHGIGRIEIDGHQMPGVFFLRDGKVVRSFRHRNISDQPDYLKLIA